MFDVAWIKLPFFVSTKTASAPLHVGQPVKKDGTTEHFKGSGSSKKNFWALRPLTIAGLQCDLGLKILKVNKY